ncbi:MAG: helix-turn-helix domain-containing protein [Sphingobacteriales bacterium]|nr:helix-turn-helix domain-containing protein [Sphingobacteriales bacterium]
MDKIGKSIDPYYVVKALQLYIEGVPFREIERILGVSHVSVMNWVKKYKIQAPELIDYRPTYKVMTREDLSTALAQPDYLKNSSMIVNELGDKLMVIKWDRK